MESIRVRRKIKLNKLSAEIKKIEIPLLNLIQKGGIAKKIKIGKKALTSFELN